MRSTKGVFAPSNFDVVEDDEFTADLVDAYDAFAAFKPCDNDSGSYIRGIYTGDSKWTEKRKRNKQAELAATMANSNPITSYFMQVSSSTSQQSSNRNELHTDDNDNQQEIVLPMIIDPNDQEALSIILQKLWEVINDFGSQLNSSEKAHLGRYTAVKNYVNFILKNPKASLAKASMDAAKMTFQGVSPTSTQRGRAIAIRCWAKEFVVDGGISVSRQGQHMKTVSILGGEDVKARCLEWLKEKKPMQRDIHLLKKWIDENLWPVASLDVLFNNNGNENEDEGGSIPVSKPTGVTVNTIRSYLSKWGFSFRKNIKGIFYDGHERPDVVRYREEWASRMMAKSKSMVMYEGEDMEVEIEPTLQPGHKRHVMVTHDESVFYANDGKDKGWFLPGEIQLRSKGPGRSIMVSEFQCPCHGTMRNGGMVSRKLFEHGAGREGYWTHHDVVKQLKEEVIPLFKALHPGCMGTFLFDQSSNHKAYADDALVASRMNLNPHRHPNDKPCVRKSSYSLNGMTKPQDFYVMKPTGKRQRDGTSKMETHFKGVKAILEERGLWHDEDFSPGREGMKWRLFCGNSNTINNEGNTECCARHCLANQPDFLFQRCAIQETLHSQHLLTDFYPKFHCECNWIERYWADLKRYTRRNCDYSYDGLKRTLSNAFDDASPPDKVPTKIRRYYMRCWRYIDAYSRKLDAADAEHDVCRKFKTTTYSSHRKIGTSD